MTLPVLLLSLVGLGALRLQLWQCRIAGMSEGHEGLPEVLELLLHWVAAVR